MTGLQRLVHGLLSLLPVGNIILFESHSDFSDNSRALFEYLIKHDYNIKYKMIWYVDRPEHFQDINIPNVKFIHLSPQRFYLKLYKYYYLYRGKYGFFSHRLPEVKPNHGEIFVNLWHGSGLKKTTHVDMINHVDYLHCSSDFFRNNRVKNFGYPKEMILNLGNPRNDWLTSEPIRDRIREVLKLDKKKIVMWLPTFHTKKNGTSEFSSEENGICIDSLTADQLSELNQYLMQNKMLLIYKPHPMEKIKLVNTEGYECILIIDNDVMRKLHIPLYGLLGLSHGLITDISSVYTDYLLLDKPIGFVIDRLDDYKYGYHVEEPLDYMPGIKISNVEELMSFFVSIGEGTDHFREVRKELNHLFNEKKSDFSKGIVEYYKL